MTLFCIAFSCLKVKVHSCTVGYEVARFSNTWECSCMIFHYPGNQLHDNQSIQYCAYGEISATAYMFVQHGIMML